jgi:hypothetical protein
LPVRGTEDIHRPNDSRARLRQSENETLLVTLILRPEDGGAQAACEVLAHGVFAIC